MSTIKINTAYLKNLTPLRGIAAPLTVIYHVDIIVSVFFEDN